MTETLNGVDISSHQKGINVGKEGIPADFVISKVTGGTQYKNSDSERALKQAEDAGKLLGVYHFAREVGFTNDDPINEAQYFLDNVQAYIGRAVLILDYETPIESKWTQKDVEWAKKFLNYVKEQTGIKPLIYISKNHTREVDWSSVASEGYLLWMAQYADMNPVQGYDDDPWTDNKGVGAFKKYILFQYTSTGQLPEWKGNLDFDKFYGNKEDWKKLTTSWE